MWLRTERAISSKTKGIFVAGLGGVVLGGLWNFTFPINKKLWTSSYVLFAAGFSLLLLAVCLVLVDRRKSSVKSKFLAPWVIFGTNAIAAYVFSELLQSTLNSIPVRQGLNLQRWIYLSIQHVVPNLAFASLLYSVGFVIVCWAFVDVLYRRNIFLKV
jgi:predicted acyltransferase